MTVLVVWIVCKSSIAILTYADNHNSVYSLSLLCICISALFRVWLCFRKRHFGMTRSRQSACLASLSIQMKGIHWCWRGMVVVEQRVWIWYSLLVRGSHVLLHLLHPAHLSPPGWPCQGVQAWDRTLPPKGLIGMAPLWCTWSNQLNSGPRPSVCYYYTSDKAANWALLSLRPHMSAYADEMKLILQKLLLLWIQYCKKAADMAAPILPSVRWIMRVKI